jgi:hypothetical protein
LSVDADKADIFAMETAFKGRSDLSTWGPGNGEKLLDEIDKCFVNNYYEDGHPCNSLFFPSCADNLNRFDNYCMAVDEVLRTHNDAPPYARQYFAYAMIWKKHGHKFPMPLGTKSLVEAVDTLAKKYCRGLREVSSSIFVYCRVLPWSPLAHSKACHAQVYLSA